MDIWGHHPWDRSAWPEHREDLQQVLFGQSVLQFYGKQNIITTSSADVESIVKLVEKHPLNVEDEPLSVKEGLRFWEMLVPQIQETCTIGEIKAEVLRQVKLYIDRGLSVLASTTDVTADTAENDKETAEGDGKSLDNNFKEDVEKSKRNNTSEDQTVNNKEADESPNKPRESSVDLSAHNDKNPATGDLEVVDINTNDNDEDNNDTVTVSAPNDDANSAAKTQDSDITEKERGFSKTESGSNQLDPKDIEAANLEVNDARSDDIEAEAETNTANDKDVIRVEQNEEVEDSSNEMVKTIDGEPGEDSGSVEDKSEKPSENAADSKDTINETVTVEPSDNSEKDVVVSESKALTSEPEEMSRRRRRRSTRTTPDPEENSSTKRKRSTSPQLGSANSALLDTLASNPIFSDYLQPITTALEKSTSPFETTVLGVLAYQAVETGEPVQESLLAALDGLITNNKNPKPRQKRQRRL